MATRPYSSPLRDRQAQQTRDHLLDTLTELLETKGADEITTRELARAAEVSERTVYRHFPDRQALRVGLADRLEGYLGGNLKRPQVESIDDFGPAAIALLGMLDEYRVEARAEALLNSDPRRYSPDTTKNSEHFKRLILSAFPDLDEREVVCVSGVVRCLLSTQAWLRMREEFDIPGAESGPTVAWVIDLIFDALRRGEHPVPSSSSSPTSEAR